MRELLRIVGTSLRLIVSSALIALMAHEAAAQLPVASLRLATGFGVDTTGSPARDVFRLWQRYLTEPSDSVRATLWSRSERAEWQPFDLVAPYVHQGFSDYTVVRLAPAVGLQNDSYLITTLVSRVEDSTRAVRPLALFRTYAIREGGRWVLANALPRMTRSWRHETVGVITFVFPPSHKFDVRRARATAAFADSLAAAFRRPPPQPIAFYFTSNLEDTFRALGLEFFPLGSDTIGGRSNRLVRHVYVGGAQGEADRHEIAHIVLGPEVSHRSAPLLVEGLMTWTGGSAGMSYAELLPGLARYIVAHPTLSLELVMEEPPPRVGTLDVGYDGMAVLCDLVHAKKGIAGVRALMHAGRTPREVLEGAARQLGVSRAALDRLWRKTILAHRR